jgi:hypothetical protein
LTNKTVDATIELNKATKSIETTCNRSLKYTKRLPDPLVALVEVNWHRRMPTCYQS